MNLIFQYSPESLQEAYILHYKKTAPFRGRILLFLGILMIWTGLLLMLIMWNKKGGQVLNYSFILYGTIIILVYTWIMNNLGKRAYKKLKGYYEPINISVGEEGINMKTEKGEQQVSWEAIQFAVMTDTIMLLYPSKTAFYIFPKKDFSEGEFAPFIELVKEKVAMVK